MYIIGFNGPPRSGKDTIGGYLAEHIEEVTGIQPQIHSLSMPMRRVIYSLLGRQYDWQHYEAFKDTPQPLFNGQSIRQVMIKLSEHFVKPNYGKDYWARSLVGDIWPAYLAPQKTQIVIVPDIGFIDEVKYFEQEFGDENVLTVHTDRVGTNFNRDSRSYVHGHNVTRIVNNSDSLEDAKTEAIRIYGRLVNQFGWNLPAKA